MVFCSLCLSLPQSQYIDCFISQCSSFSAPCHSLSSVSLPLSISDAFTTFSLCLINSSTQHGFPDHERASSPVIDYMTLKSWWVLVQLVPRIFLAYICTNSFRSRHISNSLPSGLFLLEESKLPMNFSLHFLLPVILRDVKYRTLGPALSLAIFWLTALKPVI